MRNTKVVYLSMIALLAALAVAMIAYSNHEVALSSGPKIDPAVITNSSGLQGTFDEKKAMFRATLPRNGLNVSVQGVAYSADFGLTAWAAITGTAHHAVLIGDLPLLEGEVSDYSRKQSRLASIWQRYTTRFSRTRPSHVATFF